MICTLLRSLVPGTGRLHPASIPAAPRSLPLRFGSSLLLLLLWVTLVPQAGAQPVPTPIPDIFFAPVFTKAAVGRPVVQANFLATQTPRPAGHLTEPAVMPSNFFSASLFGGHSIELSEAWIEVTSSAWQLRVYDTEGHEIKNEEKDGKTFWTLPVTLKDPNAETGTWTWSGAFEVVKSSAVPQPPGGPHSLTLQLKYKTGLLAAPKAGPSEEIWPADVWLVAGGGALAQLNSAPNTEGIILWEATPETQSSWRVAGGPHGTVAGAFAAQWRHRCLRADLDRTVVVVVVPSPGARLRDWCAGAVPPPATADAGRISLFRQAQRLWAVPWEKVSPPPDYGATFHYRGLVFWHGAQDADFAEGTHDEEIGRYDPSEWPPLVGEPAKNSVRSAYASALANSLLLPWWKSQVPADGGKFTAHPLQVLLVQPPPVSRSSPATQNRMDQWEKAPGKVVSPKFNEPVSTLAAIRFAQFDVARHFELAKKDAGHPEANRLFNFATPEFAAGQVNLLFPVQAAPSQDGKLQPLKLEAAGTTLAELAFWQQDKLETSLCPTLTGSAAAGWQILAWPLEKIPDRWLHFAQGPKPAADQNPKLHWPAGSGQAAESSGALIPDSKAQSGIAIRTQPADAPEGPWPHFKIRDPITGTGTVNPEAAAEVPLPVFDLPLIKRPP